jgi:hypothetical protein
MLNAVMLSVILLNAVMPRVVTLIVLVPMGLYHPIDGVANLKYKLYFLTPDKKKNSERNALAFNWDRCCHLAICLLLISLPLLYSGSTAAERSTRDRKTGGSYLVLARMAEKV